MRPKNPNRSRELAMIHMGAKQLGMERDAYEAMLWTCARVRSAGDLDDYGRRQVIDHLRRCGAQFKPRRPKPAPDKQALVRKIRALLATASRPDSYADGMAQKMFTVDRFEWCTPEQLRAIVAALVYDGRRRAKKQQSTGREP